MRECFDVKVGGVWCVERIERVWCGKKENVGVCSDRRECVLRDWCGERVGIVWCESKECVVREWRVCGEWRVCCVVKSRSMGECVVW